LPESRFRPLVSGSCGGSAYELVEQKLRLCS
jgi:hypothetical protein